MSQTACVYCRDAFGDEQPLSCSACGVQVHRSCQLELLRCSTMGCVGVFQTIEREPLPFVEALPEREESAPEAPLKGEPESVPVPVPVSAPASAFAGRARRWVQRVAFGVFGLLFLTWLTTLPRSKGVERELGGWFRGHGGTFSAVYGTLTGSYRTKFGNASVRAVAFSPDGKQVVSADLDREVIRWDVAAGTVISERRMPFAPVYGRTRWVGVDETGRVFASVGVTLQVYAENQPSAELDMGRFPLGDPHVVAGWLAPDGSHVRLAFVNNRPALHVVEARGDRTTFDGGKDRRGESVVAGKVPSDVWAACFSPDGETLFVALGAQVERWDLREKTRKRLVLLDSPAQALAISPDGKRLAHLNSVGSVGIVDLESGKREGILIVSKNGSLLAFGPNDLLAVVARRSVSIWHAPQVGSPKSLASYKGHGSLTYQATFSPDGKLLATCSKDQTVKLWRVP